MAKSPWKCDQIRTPVPFNRCQIHSPLLPSLNLFSCPGSSIPGLGHSLSDCQFRILTQGVTFETWDPSDSWSGWCQDNKTKKDKKTKMKKRQKGKNTKTRLGSFALLLCFLYHTVKTPHKLKHFQMFYLQGNPNSWFGWKGTQHYPTGLTFWPKHLKMGPTKRLWGPVTYVQIWKCKHLPTHSHSWFQIDWNKQGI